MTTHATLDRIQAALRSASEQHPLRAVPDILRALVLIVDVLREQQPAVVEKVARPRPPSGHKKFVPIDLTPKERG